MDNDVKVIVIAKRLTIKSIQYNTLVIIRLTDK